MEVGLVRTFVHTFVRFVAILAISMSTAAFAQAASVNVVGLFPGKAVVSIDGAALRTMSAGETRNGVKLVSTTGDSATFIVEGRQQTLALGQYFAGRAASGRASTTLVADGRGHYLTQGTINGAAVTFLVDTGATLVVLSGAEATRMGIAYKRGREGTANTANGAVPFWLVTLDTVKVGDIVLNNVPAGVQEAGLSGMSLLGMSFLSRTEMSRDGQNMVLTKRF